VIDWEYLARWRNRKAWSHVRGRLLDIGCGLNTFVCGYAGPGCGVDVHHCGPYPQHRGPSTRWARDVANVRLLLLLPPFFTVSFLACLNHTSRIARLSWTRRFACSSPAVASSR
jgi:hypothetical protein